MHQHWHMAANRSKVDSWAKRRNFTEEGDPLVKCKKFSVTFATFLITRRLGII